MEGVWLDPCDGGDDSQGMSYPEILKEAFDVDTMTIDIRKDSKAETHADYLLTKWTVEPNVIITNPPFSLALPIIQKAISEIASDGWVVMLLRLNFLEGAKRYAFFENNMPNRIYVHHKRMSFTSDGKTDSVAYAHFCWQKGNKNDCIIKVI